MNAADDLRGAITYALSDALAKVMNAQAPDCPPLYWSFRYGEVWSRASRGTVEHSGEIHGLPDTRSATATRKPAGDRQ